MGKKTGNPRGKYTDPANLNKPCKYGCGKTGNAGAIAAHAKHYCSKRPDITPPAAESKPAAQPAQPTVRPQAGAARVAVEFDRIHLYPLPPFTGA